MYTSVDAYDSTDEQALTSIQELFKAVSSEKEADTPVHPSGTNFKSDVEPVALPGYDHKTYQSSHTGTDLRNQMQIQLFLYLPFTCDRRK